MTVEYIRYKIDKGNRNEFMEAYRRGAQQLDSSEYCKAYELTECEEEEGQFILRIEWTSTDEHLNGFRKSELFAAFFSNVKPFFDNIQEMRHYRQTGIAKKK